MVAYEAAETATQMCRRTVNNRAVSHHDWTKGADLFIRSVRGGHLVSVPINANAGQ